MRGADHHAGLVSDILDLAGAKPQPSQVVDGASLVPLLRDKGSVAREALYWHYPHYHPGGATPYGAIRQGDWRLVEFFEDNHVELYNLKRDVGETKDLAQEMPDKARELQRKLRSANVRRRPDARPQSQLRAFQEVARGDILAPS